MYEVQRMRMLANQAKAAGYTALQTDPAEDPESWREALEKGIEIQVGGGQTAVFKMEGPSIIKTE